MRGRVVRCSRVAPHTGAWIETPIRTLPRAHPPSRPTRARGLKQEGARHCGDRRQVAPHTGAWIETACACSAPCGVSVAPHTGAWIETLTWNCHSVEINRRAPHGRAWIDNPTHPLPAKYSSLPDSEVSRGLYKQVAQFPRRARASGAVSGDLEGGQASAGTGMTADHWVRSSSC
jgi:hypothetical protein